jgi:hypothetical protein
MSITVILLPACLINLAFEDDGMGRDDLSAQIVTMAAVLS